MNKPEINIQWKSIDICADFQCECSNPADAFEFHVDGWSFGRLRCPRCKTVWRLAHSVAITRDEDQDSRALQLSDTPKP